MHGVKKARNNNFNSNKRYDEDRTARFSKRDKLNRTELMNRTGSPRAASSQIAEMSFDARW